MRGRITMDFRALITILFDAEIFICILSVSCENTKFDTHLVYSPVARLCVAYSLQISVRFQKIHILFNRGGAVAKFLCECAHRNAVVSFHRFKDSSANIRKIFSVGALIFPITQLLGIYEHESCFHKVIDKVKMSLPSASWSATVLTRKSFSYAPKPTAFQ